MKRAYSLKDTPGLALGVLVCAVALTTIACDTNVDISHSKPKWIKPISGDRGLEISGTLVAENGSCREATILYDDKELAGARAVCPDPSGCVSLTLDAVTRSRSGNHTISFQVLHQSQEVVDYLVEGSVILSDVDLGMGGFSIPLGPTRASLRTGDEVTFDIEFRD
jgi:hypothetical protein